MGREVQATACEIQSLVDSQESESESESESGAGSLESGVRSPESGVAIANKKLGGFSEYWGIIDHTFESNARKLT